MREARMIPGPAGMPSPPNVCAAVRRLLRTEVGKKLYLHEPLCDNEVAQLSNAKEPEDTGFILVRLLNARWQMLQNQNWRPRDQSIRFAVGQFYRHRKFGYRAVIFGFHKTCEQSKEWQEQMGISKLQRGAEQPFYQSLVDSRDREDQNVLKPKITYVAEENVQPCALEDFQFPGYDRYFQTPLKVLGRYVLVDKELRMAFPDDAYVSDVMNEFSQ
eukprot:gnl/MRDRNA2_/MRDRNA2_31987_c0_seq1.p1 gnl/MRDRNA2_/MRDRNA2_31987_c0~~gnl/MRDRNA2_/MRDRNA2_31987_c0_seq1.p1  ORF type:complete len:216 (+),score=39.54 gnl/MRDRNA2_/MRDRNA2_31987_c0_seq1:230-877(+)